MSELSEFFFTAPQSAVRLQVLEISHPSFSQTYRVVRNMVGTIQVRHENNDVFTYTHFPMVVNEIGSDNSLDQEIEVTLGDLGRVLPQELDRVNNDNAADIKPVLVYREYVTTNFHSASGQFRDPVRGPFTLEINTIAFNKQGATFVAKPPAFNKTRTGEYYTVERFPMLRGFL